MSHWEAWCMVVGFMGGSLCTFGGLIAASVVIFIVAAREADGRGSE